MNSSGHGGKRPNQTGRPPKWGKRQMWGVWLPVELARAADVFRRRDKASQSELVTRALVELLKGAADVDDKTTEKNETA